MAIRPGSAGGTGPRRSGFTLIEMAVVILILGILFGITVASVSGLAPIYRVRSTSRTIGTEIENLRAMAIATGRPQGLRYTLLDGPHYWQIIPPPSDEYPDEPIENRKLGVKMELPLMVRFRRIVLPGGRPIDRGAVDIVFSPMGNTGSHIVTLEGRGKDGKPIVLSLKFNAITGTIDFSEGDAEFQHFEG